MTAVVRGLARGPRAHHPVCAEVERRGSRMPNLVLVTPLRSGMEMHPHEMWTRFRYILAMSWTPDFPRNQVLALGARVPVTRFFKKRLGYYKKIAML